MPIDSIEHVYKHIDVTLEIGYIPITTEFQATDDDCAGRRGESA